MSLAPLNVYVVQRWHEGDRGIVCVCATRAVAVAEALDLAQLHGETRTITGGATGDTYIAPLERHDLCWLVSQEPLGP